jgi:hypothetical protein
MAHWKMKDKLRLMIQDVEDAKTELMSWEMKAATLWGETEDEQ